MADVLIAMPTWNKREVTQPCIQALLAHTDLERPKAAFYIVDNGSTDGLAEWLHSEIEGAPGVHIIYNEVNVGMCHAINQAWAYRKPGQHAVYLNSDARLLRADWLHYMLEVFRQREDVGMVALVPGRQGHIRRILREKHIAIGSEGRFWHSGLIYTACALMRDKLLDQLGGLWQPGIYGFEDHCTCMRVKGLGWVRGWLDAEAAFCDHGSRDHRYPRRSAWAHAQRRAVAAPNSPTELRREYRLRWQGSKPEDFHFPLPAPGTVYTAENVPTEIRQYLKGMEGL